MSQRKSNLQLEDQLISFFEKMIDNKMQSLESELKQASLKAVEEYCAKAIQTALKESMQSMVKADGANAMGMSSQQTLNQFATSFSRHFISFF